MGASGNIFIGYSAGEKNNFRVILIFLGIGIVLAIFWIVSFGYKKEEKPVPREKVAPKVQKEIKVVLPEAKIGVLEKATCRKITKNNLPEKISAAFFPQETIYFYTRLMAKSVPQTIKHVWIDPKGKVYADVALQIIRQPADTWSYITLPPKNSGKWAVKIIADDKTVDELSFEVK